MAEDTSAPAGTVTGGESSLSTYAGDYVTDMLGRGQALGSQDYQAYTGPLTAGSSELQDAAFSGIGSLTLPTDDMGVSGYQTQSFTGTPPNISNYGAESGAGLANTGVSPNLIEQYMNPYIMTALQPQIDEARRQSEIDRLANASRLTQAGAFGGARQAVIDSENQRALQSNLANITGQGYKDAYAQALNQFNLEQDREMTAQDKINLYGTQGLKNLADMGATQRGIESEGITADRLQFEEERDFPFKQVQYMQSLLSGLPISAQNYSYSEPSFLSEMLSGAGGIGELYDILYGKKSEAKT